MSLSTVPVISTRRLTHSICNARVLKSDQQNPTGLTDSQERCGKQSGNVYIRTLCAPSPDHDASLSSRAPGLSNIPHKQSQQTKKASRDWILIRLHYYSGLPLAVHYSHMEPVWVVITQSDRGLYSGEHAFVYILFKPLRAFPLSPVPADGIPNSKVNSLRVPTRLRR